MQSTPENGHRAGFGDTKEREGTKVHLTIDTLGHVLAVFTSPANEQDRAPVVDLCLEVQEATGVKVEIADAGQGHTGAQTALEASRAGVEAIGAPAPS